MDRNGGIILKEIGVILCNCNAGWNFAETCRSLSVRSYSVSFDIIIIIIIVVVRPALHCFIFGIVALCCILRSIDVGFERRKRNTVKVHCVTWASDNYLFPAAPTCCPNGP